MIKKKEYLRLCLTCQKGFISTSERAKYCPQHLHNNIIKKTQTLNTDKPNTTKISIKPVQLNLALKTPTESYTHEYLRRVGEQYLSEHKIYTKFSEKRITRQGSTLNIGDQIIISCSKSITGKVSVRPDDIYFDDTIHKIYVFEFEVRSASIKRLKHKISRYHKIFSGLEELPIEVIFISNSPYHNDLIQLINSSPKNIFFKTVQICCG